MNADVELEIWREQWQTEETIPVDLRKKVEKQSRWMRIGVVGDIAVTVVIGGGSTAWTLMSKDSGITLVAVASWLFLGAAWTFVLTANRGLWSPSSLDTAGFVDLSIRRCRSALRAVWAACALFIVEIVFGLSWAYTYSNVRPPLLKWLFFGSLRIDLVWLCTATFVGMVIWFRNKKRSELEELLRLREEIISENNN